MNEELNKKLAEWRGFTIRDYPKPKLEPDEKAWFDPDGVFYSGLDHFIDFPADLNACFKWLVPKLHLQDNWLYDIEFTYNHPNGGITCDIRREVDLIQAQAETPALALCLAIEKLIEEVKS